MPRLSPIASAALFVVAVLVGVLISRANHDNAPPPQKDVNQVGHQSWEPTPSADSPTDAKRVAANRDYPYYAAMGGIGTLDLVSRIEAVAYANSASPNEASEDHRRGQLIADRLIAAKKQLTISAKITKESGDPLPLWSVKAQLDSAQADWFLRQEVLKELKRQHQSVDVAKRLALEAESHDLAIRVRKHWDANYAGIHVVTNTPVTALP